MVKSLKLGSQEAIKTENSKRANEVANEKMVTVKLTKVFKYAPRGHDVIAAGPGKAKIPERFLNSAEAMGCLDEDDFLDDGDEPDESEIDSPEGDEPEGDEPEGDEPDVSDTTTPEATTPTRGSRSRKRS